MYQNRLGECSVKGYGQLITKALLKLFIINLQIIPCRAWQDNFFPALRSQNNIFGDTSKID
jgi:hypothetical protein